MDFRRAVQASLKTKEQILNSQQEAARKQREQLILRAAQYIYEGLKNEIIHKASNGEAENGMITGIFKIPDNGEYDDIIPYGNIFKTESHFTYKRSGGIFAFHDVNRTFLEVQDLDTLDEVYCIIFEWAKRDGIQFSEPFLLAQVHDCTTRELLRAKKFMRKNNKLSASLKTDSYLSKGKRTGESGSISLVVEYSYQI